MPELQSARVLVDGEASGEVLVLDEPLSLWGGLDAASGAIVDPRHPQVGESVTDRVLVLPRGRGSSSASSILLEAVRLGTAPSALLLMEDDGILALGAAVAREMYGRHPVVLELSQVDYRRAETGQTARIEAGGHIVLSG